MHHGRFADDAAAALRPQARDVEAYVVQPIGRVLRRLDEAGQHAAMLLLAKILTAAAIAHPSLVLTALATLTRSTVRTALLCAPLLALWPWQRLGGAELWKAWCEIYRVPPTRLEDFSQRHPLQQHAQQKEFMNFQLSHSSAAASVRLGPAALQQAPRPRPVALLIGSRSPFVAVLRVRHAAGLVERRGQLSDGHAAAQTRTARRCPR